MSDPRAFRRALGHFATGVTIVTAQAAGAKVGVTANSFSSVSLDPPLVLWSIDRKSRSAEVFLAASHFCVNVLSADQIDVSTRFAKSGADKFDGVESDVGMGGAPLLPEAVVQLECRRHQECDGGDHIIMIGHVERYTRFDREILAFARGRYGLIVDRPFAPTTAPQEGAAPAGLEPRTETLMSQLFVAYELLSAAFHQYRREQNVSINQSRILNRLVRCDRSTAEQLAKDAFLGRQAADDAISSLVERGLVDQCAGHPVEVYATEEGRELATRLRQGANAVEQDLVAKIPSFDIEAARRVLTSISQANPDQRNLT